MSAPDNPPALPFLVIKKGESYEAKCPKGMWSVSGRERSAVVNQAKHYFSLYMAAGEYAPNAATSPKPATQPRRSHE